MLQLLHLVFPRFAIFVPHALHITRTSISGVGLAFRRQG
jgi:hypothetical protein